MDEPIIYTRYKVSLATHFSPYQSILYQSLYCALANDEKDEFMRLIRDPGFEELRDRFTANRIFHEDALEIAIAVFNGETKGLIDMEDVLKDGMTPLHLATISRAPRLTKYLLQRGYKADAVCDHKKLDLEHATPLDLSISAISTGWSNTLFDILWRVCFHNRDDMEVIRMLVQSKQNTMWAWQAFLKYAHKGELHKLVALFLAVPELFLSSPKSKPSLLSILDLKLNSLENKTHNDKLLSLLLDVFALVGQKLAAYIRLEEFAVKGRTTEEIDQSHLEIDLFLREVARKKLGVFSSDYYLRFFECIRQKPDDYVPADDEYDPPDWDECTADLAGNQIFDLLPGLLFREDFKRTDIYRLIPSLDRHDAAYLTRAIEKKLSPVSALHGCLETVAKTSKISKKMEKHQRLGFPIVSSRSFEPCLRSFHTSVDSANPTFGVKFTATKNWENKVMQSTKLKSFFDFVKLSQFPLVAKCLVK